MLDLGEVQRCKITKTHNCSLRIVLLKLLLLLLHLHHLLLLQRESILHLLLHGAHFLLERIVNGLSTHAGKVTHLMIALQLLLLNDVLDKAPLVHLDPMLLLQLLAVII